MTTPPVTVLWTAVISDRGAIKPCANDLEVHPSGSEFLVVLNHDIYVFATSPTRQMLHYAHDKHMVHCLAYCPDESCRFVSAGANGTIRVWGRPNVERPPFELSPELKHRVGVPIQCLAFKPISPYGGDQLLLAFGAGTTLGFWSFGSQKRSDSKPAKHKVSSDILCCGWSSDGAHLAVGQMDGSVTVFTQTGPLNVMIKRAAPIWTLCWTSSSRADRTRKDLLVVGCWDQTLSFYDLTGPMVATPQGEVGLEYYPCSLTSFSSPDDHETDPCALLSGSNGQVSAWNLNHLTTPKVSLELSTSWVCHAKQLPSRPDCIVAATMDAFAMMLQISSPSDPICPTSSLAIPDDVLSPEDPRPDATKTDHGLAIPLLATCWTGSFLRMEVLLELGADFTARMSCSDDDKGKSLPRSAMQFCSTWSFRCPRKTPSEISQRRRLLSTHIEKAFRLYRSRLSCLASLSLSNGGNSDDRILELTIDLLGVVAEFLAVYWRLADPLLRSTNGIKKSDEVGFCRTLLSYCATLTKF